MGALRKTRRTGVVQDVEALGRGPHGHFSGPQMVGLGVLERDSLALGPNKTTPPKTDIAVLQGVVEVVDIADNSCAGGQSAGVLQNVLETVLNLATGYMTRSSSDVVKDVRSESPPAL